MRDDERPGRMREKITPELIAKIRSVLGEDRRSLLLTIAKLFEMPEGNMHVITHDDLNVRAVSAKFVPRLLREEQRGIRVNNSREMVELVCSIPSALNTVVTCDKSWICYDSETKQQSAQRKHLDSPRPKKARQSKSTEKPTMIQSKFNFLTATASSTFTASPTARLSTKNTMWELRKRFHRKRSELFESSEWFLHQVNTH